MEIEKTFALAAAPARVWAMLLDPQLMAECVPGMQSVEVVSPTEYTAVIKVKIAFISARFKLRTTIVEQRAPDYLRTEGTGEDTSVASALKQTSELFLTDLGNGQTELRTRVVVDVTGRLGSFGLSVMKTKADRMWDEFCANLARRVGPEASTVAPAAVAPQAIDMRLQPAAHEPENVLATDSTPPSAPIAPPHAPIPLAPVAAVALPAVAELNVSTTTPSTVAPSGTWWTGFLASIRGNGSPSQSMPSLHHIRVELRKGASVINVDWPVTDSAQCLAWLREVARG